MKLITNEVKLPKYKVKLRILSVKTTVYEAAFHYTIFKITSLAVKLSDIDTDITVRKVRLSENAGKIK